MKFSTILPFVTASPTKKANKNDDEKTLTDERSIIPSALMMNHQDLCSNQILQFETTNDGQRGTIIVENYPDFVSCKEEIEVNPGCTEVNFTYTNVALPGSWNNHYGWYHGDESCKLSGFWFASFRGWSESDSTPPRCHCYGDGCTDHNVEVSSYVDYDMDSYTAIYELSDYKLFKHQFDSGEVNDSLSINVDESKFKFFFFGDADPYYGYARGGHIMVNWECNEPVAQAK